MKEIQQIIKAYQESQSRSQRVALATVVQVDGSAYRRPGARMLVTESGELTGAISGGCLEGDALRKAQAVIFQQQAKLVTYDTTDEDDQKFGVGLGCNGIIHVLIEPIDPGDPCNPIELLILSQHKREAAVLVTVFSVVDPHANQVGTIALLKENQHTIKTAQEPNLLEIIKSDSQKVFAAAHDVIATYAELEDSSIFFEWVDIPVRLLLFGAGNDTKPVAALADLLGWQVTLIDGRSNLATNQRFPTVETILVSQPDQLTIDVDHRTVVLLMTHNFDYELGVLRLLASRAFPYLGILGPKKKSEKMLDRLSAEGIQINMENLYAPIGLDLGAEGPEEIALAVCAEIKSVLNRKKPIFLREKTSPIHQHD
jgi:xanthine dehydrogenase accessory factor